ncbi:hypothetical protein HBI74_158230 [Parastagonospora nodorum]|nr:hypothetical protein HBI74_158230 [Parastagonospora nodorum]
MVTLHLAYTAPINPPPPPPSSPTHKSGPGCSAKSDSRRNSGFGTSWVDFEQEDGSVVKNVISDGADGALYMTYAFEFRFPDLREGSAEAEAQREKLKGTSKMAVEKSIETIRQMVLDGRIKE